MHSSGTRKSAERLICAAGEVAGFARRAASPLNRRRWRRPVQQRSHQRAASVSEARRYPAGLFVLCGAEACAGFALYVLGSLLVLYLTEVAGQEQATALGWLGVFNAVCFVMPLAGGWLADRWLGFRWAVIIGAGLLSAGFVMLALVPTKPLSGLTLLLGGSGLFRSNLVAMVGRLFASGEAGRERAFRLLYAAFNVGAVLAPPIASILIRAQRWSLAFLLGSGATAMALVILGTGHQRLARVDQRDDEQRDSPNAPDQPVGKSPRWLAIGAVAQVALLWTVAYGQADGTLLLWARDHTRRSLLGFDVPASIFASVPPLLVLLLTPLSGFAGRSRIKGSALAQLLLGLGCTSLGFLLMLGAARDSAMPASPVWLLGCLGLLTVGELVVAPLTQSLISGLAPRRSAGLSSALWYGATAAGFWLAGQLGGLWRSCPPATFFGLLAVVPLLAGVLLLVQRSYWALIQKSAAPAERPLA